MILVRYTAAGPREGARWFQHELRSDDLIVIRDCHRGGILDETLLPEGATGWAGVRCVLEGPVAVHRPGGTTDLHPGDVFVSPIAGSAPVRSLTSVTDVLHIVWRCEGAGGSAIAGEDALSLSPQTRASLRALVDALATDDAPPLHALDDSLAALRAEGIPVRGPSSVGTPGGEEEVARALERVMFPLSSQPMSVDLARALGVGEHHALRRVNQYFQRFHLSTRSWRDYLRGQRLALGAFFMGRPDATTEEVACALGFRSPTSFCHAFQDAGLPSPRALQQALLAS